MSAITANLSKALPSLLGVLLGIFLFQLEAVLALGILLAILLVSFLLLQAGKSFMGKSPQTARILIELWLFSAVAVLAACTWLILWLTVNASSFFKLEKDKLEAVSGALVGAVTAFLAVMWSSDIEAASGPFWPSTQFKQALQTAFSVSEIAPPGDAIPWEVVWEERVRDNSPVGHFLSITFLFYWLAICF